MKAQVSLHPRLIGMFGRTLYEGHPLPILVREAVQNSRDACRRKSVNPKISVVIEKSGDFTEVEITDNGIGMTQKEILDDFLCLGGSGKARDQESVGGFGIAKAAIMANDFWAVHSLDNYLDSDILAESGEIEKRDKIDGTKITAVITDDISYSTIKKAVSFLIYSEIEVHLDIKVNFAEYTGKVGISNIPDDNHPVKEFAKTDDFTISGGSKYTLENDAVEWEFQGLDIYRLGGLVQFIRENYNRKTNLFIDIYPNGARPEDDNYPFTMSRESIKSEIHNAIYPTLKKIKVNPLTTDSMVRDHKIYDGVYREKGDFILGHRGRPLDTNKGRPPKTDTIAVGYEDEDEARAALREHRNLLSVWKTILEIGASSYDRFGIGLIIGSCGAQRRHYEGQSYYLINPEHFTFNDYPNLDAAILSLWTLAAHELTHFNLSNHDEHFTTEHYSIMDITVGDLLDHMPRLRRMAKR